MITSTWQDLTYAVRSLRRTPGFTAAAIVTLALGMGANTTIFTLLDAVLFKPLPVSRPNELFALYENAPDAEPDALPDSAGGTGRYLRFSYPRFLRLQEALGNDGQLAGDHPVHTIRGTAAGVAAGLANADAVGHQASTSRRSAPRCNAAVPSPTATCSATSALTWR